MAAIEMTRIHLVTSCDEAHIVYAFSEIIGKASVRQGSRIEMLKWGASKCARRWGERYELMALCLLNRQSHGSERAWEACCSPKIQCRADPWSTTIYSQNRVSIKQQREITSPRA